MENQSDCNSKLKSDPRLLTVWIVALTVVTAFCLLLPSVATATTTYYRSIGNGGTLYSSGSATCNQDSTTVTFTGTLPADVGVGDKLSLDADGSPGPTGEYYILNRVDDQEVTLQSPCTKTYQSSDSTDDFQIDRAYASFSGASGWETSRQRDLTAATGDDSIEVAVCYKDSGPISEQVEIFGWTTGPNNYIRVWVPAGQRHNGIAGAGFALKWNGTGTNVQLFEINEEYVRIEGIEIDGSLANAPGIRGIYTKNVSNTDSDIRIDKVLVHDITKNNSETNQFEGFGIYISDGMAQITNSIVYNITNNNTNATATVIGIDFNAGTSSSYNNTVYKVVNNGSDVAARGLWRESGSVTVTNTYVGGTSGTTSYDFSGTMTANYNISSDDTADDNGGTDNLINHAAYDDSPACPGPSSDCIIFQSIDSGTEDF
ncbi:MAG: hypothetical protein GTO24_15590, partial [candidate division Zixibacteria bacterium]|nr:hypothetical protein [candidate division Zixibacteria bacterium]